MSELLNARQKFSQMVGILLAYMTYSSYQYTIDDVMAKDGHKKNSNHYLGLAIDINLFKDGKLLDKSESHQRFGVFWKLLDPKLCWGGDFMGEDGKPKPDGRHYSYEWMGSK